MRDLLGMDGGILRKVFEAGGEKVFGSLWVGGVF